VHTDTGIQVIDTQTGDIMEEIKDTETLNAENASEKNDNVLEVHGLRADMTLGEIMQMRPEIIPILMDAGMHCVSCPAALMETLEEASMVHGIPIDELMQYIKERLDQNEAEAAE
jgi:hybrid cluster-associated redox disulfide protein